MTTPTDIHRNLGGFPLGAEQRSMSTGHTEQEQEAFIQLPEAHTEFLPPGTRPGAVTSVPIETTFP